MIHQLEVQVLLLLLIASVVGMVSRRLRIPYTLALVMAGLGLSIVNADVLKDVALTPELLLLLFLPPLLFEAAYHLPFKDLRKNAVHIGFLAVIGVCFAVGITAVFLYAGIRLTGFEIHFEWSHAFLLAAVISATDPISVLALFKELGAPKRLYQVVEGESLVNDGIAVVIFAIISAVIGVNSGHGNAAGELHGAREIVGFALTTFIKTGFGGMLVGSAIGALASVLTRQVDDHLIEITLTSLVAWGSFLVAEEVHTSGVLSTVCAGIMMGSFGKHYGMSASTRIAVQDFWEYMGFLSNSFIFLLIGIELDPRALARQAVIVVVAFVAVVLARAILVYGGLPIADRFTNPLPKKWRHVLVWGGLRGSLSMVLILGLPTDFVGRPLLIDLVFGVVAISLFLQGLTMAPLMRKLGIVDGTGLASSRAYELARGRAIAFRHVINGAQKLAHDGMIDEPTFDRLKTWYDSERSESQKHATELAGATAQPERLLEGARALGTLEQEAIGHAVHAGVISEGAGAELLSQLSNRLDALDQAAHESEASLMETFAKRYAQPESDADEGDS